MSVVDNLCEWFEKKLSHAEQKEVLQFLYGDQLKTVQLREGLYCGPTPGLLGSSYRRKGLFCGPEPSSQNVSRCPTCGKPY